MFKEDWYTTSYLTVTYEKIINFNDLLSMDEISYITILINSSIEIPGTGFAIRTSWYEDIWYFSTLHEDFETVYVTLYNRKTPLFLDFMFVKFEKEAFIPSESVFNAHLLMLERLSKIVLVGEIEAISQDFIKLSDFLKYLFFLRFKR